MTVLHTLGKRTSEVMTAFKSVLDKLAEQSVLGFEHCTEPIGFVLNDLPAESCIDPGDKYTSTSGPVFGQYYKR